MPSARYRIWLAVPSRDPSAAAPTSTTIGWNVNGTGVNGSGRLICAAIAVRTVTKTTAPICSAVRYGASERAVIVSSKVEYMKADLSVCAQR